MSLFAEYHLFYGALLQKRPIIWRSLLTEATLYIHVHLQNFVDVTWTIHMCNVTHSYVRHDALTCLIWLNHMCDMTCSYVWHKSFICVTWLIHICDKTHALAWHDLFMCVAWHIHMRDIHGCGCVYVCVRVCTYMCVCVCVRHTQAQTQKQTQTHIYTYRHIHIYIDNTCIHIHCIRKQIKKITAAIKNLKKKETNRLPAVKAQKNGALNCWILTRGSYIVQFCGEKTKKNGDLRY